MEQNIAESHHLLNAWDWVEKNRKQVLLGVVGVAGIGLVIGYTAWSRAAREEAAGQALSQAWFSSMANRNGSAETGPELLKVAAANSGTKSGAQALLLAGGALFNSGKFADAQAAFDQFARDNAGSPLLPQALYGAGAALAAQGKLAESAQAFQSVADRFGSSPFAVQARYSQAAVLAAQSKFAEAVALYQEVARSAAGTSLGNEAALRADDLQAKLPPPAALPVPSTISSSNAAPAK
jgi:TolA-binding protein